MWRGIIYDSEVCHVTTAVLTKRMVGQKEGCPEHRLRTCNSFDPENGLLYAECTDTDKRSRVLNKVVLDKGS